MRVKNDYIFRQVADEYLLIPVGAAALTTKGLIGLSESAYLLYEKLKTSCSKQDLIQAILAEYDVDTITAEADVDAFLAHMRKLNMLEED